MKLGITGEIMRKFIFLALLLAAPIFAQDQSGDLATTAGCGSDKTKFDVNVNKKQHGVAQPESGKALVYVIEEYRNDPHYNPIILHVTTRVGLDGNWVGATHEGAYMSFSVYPGPHRLCSDVQSFAEAWLKLSGAADLNAEPGKTYFYRVLVTEYHDQKTRFRVEPMDVAEGVLMLSKTGQSTWKVKR